MKNAFIALAFVLVVSTAFASLSSETKARLQKINSNSFGRTILQTIQVELQTREDPRPQILTILREIEEQLITAQRVADDAHDEANRLFEQKIDEIDSTLEDLEETISENREVQDETSKTLDQERENFAQQSASLDNFREQLANAQAASEASTEHWNEENRRLTHVIEVLDQVRAVITERLASRFNPEFVQTSHKQLLSNLAQVKERINAKAFKKSSPGFHKLALFIAMKVENALRDEDADAEAEAALTSIVTVIDGLKAGFEAERTAQQALDEANQADFQERSTTLNNAIVQTTSDLDNLSTDITQHEETLKVAIDNIAAAVSFADEKTQERVEVVASHDNAEESYRTVTHDRTDQLQLIQEVLDIVQNQLTGLRQYAEDYLASH